MRPYKYLLPVSLAVLFCACALPARKSAPPPAAPVKREAAVKLSPEDAKKVESLYYKAVGAYSNNDMDGALKYLKDISSIHPSYSPAGELREKIKRASGIK